MQGLIRLTIELLNRHACVIVPDLGGFVVNAKGAVVERKSNRFCPPSAEVVFNPHLTHNDGLLVHAFMTEGGISFDEANRLVAEKVKSMKQELALRKEFVMEDFGTLVVEGGNVIFHQKGYSIENADAFGLHEFYFPQLSEGGETVKDKVKAKSVKSRTGIFSGGVAAAVALLLFCQPLRYGGRTDYASFSPIPVVKESVKQKMEAERKAEAERKEYYLVVATFESEAEAADFIVGAEGLSDSLSTMSCDSKFMVTYSSSCNVSEVSQKLDSLRVSYPVFQNSFVLGLKK